MIPSAPAVKKKKFKIASAVVAQHVGPSAATSGIVAAASARARTSAHDLGSPESAGISIIDQRDVEAHLFQRLQRLGPVRGEDRSAPAPSCSSMPRRGSEALVGEIGSSATRISNLATGPAMCRPCRPGRARRRRSEARRQDQLNHRAAQWRAASDPDRVRRAVPTAPQRSSGRDRGPPSGTQPAALRGLNPGPPSATSKDERRIVIQPYAEPDVGPGRVVERVRESGFRKRYARTVMRKTRRLRPGSTSTTISKPTPFSRAWPVQRLRQCSSRLPRRHARSRRGLPRRDRMRSEVRIFPPARPAHRPPPATRSSCRACLGVEPFQIDEAKAPDDIPTPRRPHVMARSAATSRQSARSHRWRGGPPPASGLRPASVVHATPPRAVHMSSRG